jgi:RNA polymerase sigma-70 factor (ECF subfamily)
MAERQAPEDDASLLAALRAGDEAAFVALVERYHTSLVRVAQAFVPSRAVAEDVAQEAWLGLLNGLQRFEGRSSLRTWLFTILVNRARTRGARERRLVPLSTLSPISEDEPAVEPERFFDSAHPHLAGHWSAPPVAWDAVPEERMLRGELLDTVRRAIEALPPQQRQVLVLRDVEGWPSAEVCNVLAISETNQRVLLHRARSKVRAAVERGMRGE